MFVKAGPHDDGNVPDKKLSSKTKPAIDGNHENCSGSVPIKLLSAMCTKQKQEVRQSKRNSKESGEAFKRQNLKEKQTTENKTHVERR